MPAASFAALMGQSLGINAASSAGSSAGSGIAEVYSLLSLNVRPRPKMQFSALRNRLRLTLAKLLLLEKSTKMDITTCTYFLNSLKASIFGIRNTSTSFATSMVIYKKLNAKKRFLRTLRKKMNGFRMRLMFLKSFKHGNSKVKRKEKEKTKRKAIKYMST